MRLNSPRRRSGIGLSQVAAIMMAAAVVAAVLFVGVIAYVLLFGRGRNGAAVDTATPDASLAADQPTAIVAANTTDPLITSQRIHVVTPGETLIGIAAAYHVPLEALKQLNHLADPGTIYPGQQLIIPAPISLTPTVPVITLAPTPTLTLVPDDPANLALLSGWPRSLTGGTEDDLNANYPRVLQRPRFTLHYQPGTYSDFHLNEAVSLVETALANVETRLNVKLDGTFDVYAAGTLFAKDDINLRGVSKSKDRKLFILLDGTGDPAERAYEVTHEMTHLVAWNTWGTPSSTMLSEGLATYTGKLELESGEYLPYDQLCLAIYATNQMQSMALIDRDYKSFQGHIENRLNYFGAACFVGYLIETYGAGPLSQVYHTSSYPDLYGGKSLDVLDAEWKDALKAQLPALKIDPLALVGYTQKVNNAYDTVFTNYNGSTQMHEAYIALDKARIALWRGDYEATDHWLSEVYRLSGFQQP